MDEEVMDLLAKIPPTPREALPFGIRKQLDEIVDQPVTTASTSVGHKSTAAGTWPRDRSIYDYDKQLPSLPVSGQRPAPRYTHPHSRSLSVSHADPSGGRYHNIRETWAGGNIDKKRGSDEWSLACVVDDEVGEEHEGEDGVEKAYYTSDEEEGGEDDGEGYYSEEEQTSSYVSSLRDVSFSSASPDTSPATSRITRARSRSRSCVDIDHAASAAGQYWYAVDENARSQDVDSSNSSLPYRAPTAASPAIVGSISSSSSRTLHASADSPSPSQAGVGPRPTRKPIPVPVRRFTGKDPTKRHAMYISPLVCPVDSPLLYAGSEVSSSASGVETSFSSFQLVEGPTSPEEDDEEGEGAKKGLFGRLVGVDAFRGAKA
ncbi:hypothetical protein EIP91_001589 [Steccherinum ochraceum]|uniref:Uncharacterized protein n=1 Tax=Steccherinum ochraceum TaxID=92696 RepID=A0A4R0RDP1_9APHY|nr:hypothetical protein EIP91_001589 [Steccherinum ochraceum]